MSVLDMPVLYASCSYDHGVWKTYIVLYVLIYIFRHCSIPVCQSICLSDSPPFDTSVWKAYFDKIYKMLCSDPGCHGSKRQSTSL